MAKDSRLERKFGLEIEKEIRDSLKKEDQHSNS